MPSEEPPNSNVLRLPNERLRHAMTESGMTVKALARRTGVHPRTVQRWLDYNRPPKDRDLREQIAKLLGVSATHLWPTQTRPAPPLADELVAYYPTAATIPAEVWNDLLHGSNDAYILTEDLAFITDEMRTFLPSLVMRVATAQRVRVMLHDPADPTLDRDDPRIDNVRDACGELQPLALAHSALAEVRLHRHRLPHSIFRFGRAMIVILHTGGDIGDDPALHLQLVDAARDQHGRIRRDVASSFAAFVHSFDTYWERPTPVNLLTAAPQVAWHDRPTPGMSAEEHLVRTETYLTIKQRLDQIDQALRELEPEPELRLRFDQILDAVRVLDPNYTDDLLTPEEADTLVNAALHRLFGDELPESTPDSDD